MIVYNNQSGLTNVYLGNTNIAKVYVGTHQVYPSSIPPTPTFEGKYKLTLNDSSIVSGDCTLNTVVKENEIKAYSATTVEAEIGTCATEIGDQAFMWFTNLEKVTIPNTITRISFNAFNQCSGLTSVDIPDSVTIIADVSFNGCKSLSSVTLSNNITRIGIGVFEECINLGGIEIPSGVTEIGTDAFKDCISLSGITIPDAVTKIGSEAFYNCTGLTTVTIGSGITEIGSGAFEYSDNITSLTIYATTPPTITNYTFTFTGSYPIYVPNVDAYKSSSKWSEYASRLEPIP